MVYASFSTYLKEKKGGVIFTFGRFNPPTKGHEENIKNLIKTSKKYGLEPIIYASPSHDTGPNARNPLPFDFKIKVLKELFKNIKISTDKNLKNAFQVLEDLGKKYSKVYFMVGDDRKDEFYNAMKNYVHDYGISDFKVISSGSRTNGISGTKQREYIEKNNFLEFYKNVPSTCSVSLAKKIFKEAQKNMGIKEK